MQTYTQATPQPSPGLDKKCIQRIKSRLERWELSHLRELAAQLHEKLEEAEQRAAYAESDAAFWSRHAQDLMAQLHEEQPDARVCLSMDGTLSVQSGVAA